LKTYRENVLELENELDLNSYKFKGENIWAFIRLSIILARPKTNSVKGSFSKKLRFLVMGMIEYSKWKLGLWPESKHVFLSSSHYKVKENGAWYDRITDPFLNWLENEKQDYVVFDFTNKFSYNELNYADRSIKLQPLIFFLSFIWRIELKFSNPDISIEGDIQLFNELSRKKNLPIQIDRKFKQRLFLLEKQSQLFERILSKMESTHVGVVCYYDFKSLALIWASNRLNLKSMDLQHGVQHSLHLAYSQWPVNIAKSSNFLPSHFYVWDSYSKQNISTWLDKSRIILGGNKWFKDRIIIEDKEIILITLQPLQNPIPPSLVKFIQYYSGKLKIYMRLHPQQLMEIDLIKNFLATNNILDKVEIEEASQLPLTSLLSKTLVHITKSSSVAIEASYFNIPTIFIDERGRQMYEPMLDKLFIHNAYTYDDLSNKIMNLRNISSRVETALTGTDEISFDNIQDFYL